MAARFDTISDGVGFLGAAEAPQVVTVSATDGMAAHWLKPLIDSFRADNPSVGFVVLASDNNNALHSYFCLDLSLLCGNERRDVGETLHFLFDETAQPVCSPAYLAVNDPFDDAGALNGANLLHLHDRHWGAEAIGWRPMGWKEWFAAQGAAWARGPSTLSTNKVSILIDAALAGEGAARGNSARPRTPAHERSGANHAAPTGPTSPFGRPRSSAIGAEKAARKIKAGRLSLNRCFITKSGHSFVGDAKHFPDQRPPRTVNQRGRPEQPQRLVPMISGQLNGASACAPPRRTASDRSSRIARNSIHAIHCGVSPIRSSRKFLKTTHLPSLHVTYDKSPTGRFAAPRQDRTAPAARRLQSLRPARSTANLSKFRRRPWSRA